MDEVAAVSKRCRARCDGNVVTELVADGCGGGTLRHDLEAEAFWCNVKDFRDGGQIGL